MRLPTVTSAMRSAASTARRIACSASSRSTTTPDLMPRERVEAKPSTSTGCVRRRSASPSRGFSRAIRQQILRRADVEHADGHRAARAERLHARYAGWDCAVYAYSRARLALGRARLGGHVFQRPAFRQPHGHAVGQAEIDDDDIAREELLLRVRASQAAQALRATRFSGSLTVTPLSRCRSQRRPATSTAARICAAISGCGREYRRGRPAAVWLAPPPTMKGSLREAGLVERHDLGAGSVDDEDLAVALPERVGLRARRSRPKACPDRISAPSARSTQGSVREALLRLLDIERRRASPASSSCSRMAISDVSRCRRRSARPRCRSRRATSSVIAEVGRSGRRRQARRAW